MRDNRDVKPKARAQVWSAVYATAMVGALGGCILFVDPPDLHLPNEGAFVEGGTVPGTGGGDYATGCASFISSQCDCFGDNAPSNVTCSSASIGDGVCCADYGWPNKGLTCGCRAYRCKDTADGCTCGTNVSGPNRACTGAHCCVFEGWCSCGTAPCDSVSKPVASCTAEMSTCASGSQRRVTTCSLKPGETLPPVDGGRG